MRAHEQRANRVRRHGEQDRLFLVCHCRPTADPVRRAVVAQVICVGRDAVERGKLVVFALAHGRRDAGLQVEGRHGVTASQAIRADATLTILRAAWGICRARVRRVAFGNVVGRRRNREGRGQGGRGAVGRPHALKDSRAQRRCPLGWLLLLVAAHPLHDRCCCRGDANACAFPALSRSCCLCHRSEATVMLCRLAGIVAGAYVRGRERVRV